MRLAGQVVLMGGARNSYKIMVGKREKETALKTCTNIGE
jgi:hypothetical protein